jgi:hypothetical protein
MTLTFASWNQIANGLRALEALRSDGLSRRLCSLLVALMTSLRLVL